MKKQLIIKEFHNMLKIENYSDQTIRNYVSVPKLFLEYISRLNIKIDENSYLEEQQ